jgi:hypothetical protein
MRKNKLTRRFVRRLTAAFATLLVWAASAPAQTVVVGTGNPDLDVPAVQAAMDQGGEVTLKGHFSFNRPPTVPTATHFAGGLATVLVSKAVAISGTQVGDTQDGDTQDGEMTSIEGGTTPFYVEAPGASVTIQGLRFIRPKRNAIFVYAATGLVIASCKIEGIEPKTMGEGSGIDIVTSPDVPTPTNPGKPENISGTLLIVNNDIDLAGGTALNLVGGVGVLIFSVGVPGAEVEVYVSGNTIRNTTEPAINIRRIAGRAYVERNVIKTGSVLVPGTGPQAIRVTFSGSYVIAHNSIDCGWAEGQGIGVFSQFAEWPMERAIVVDNDVTMSPPEGTVFTDQSAGIFIRGFAQGNVVLDNRIRGRARAALSVYAFRGGIPGNNAFVLNRFDDFEASLAEVFVGPGVMNTRIIGPGTVEDDGVGTVIVPLRAHER